MGLGLNLKCQVEVQCVGLVQVATSGMFVVLTEPPAHPFIGLENQPNPT